MAKSPPLPSLLEGNSSSVSVEKPMEHGVFVKFYSKLTIVFRNKDYLPYLVTAGIVPPDNIHYLSNLSNRDRPMRILEYISDSLDGGDKQLFYEMLEIMKGHGNNHAQNLAEEINKAVVSGVDFRIAKINSFGSVGSTRSDSIGSVTRSDSLRSGSLRSDSMGSIATSIGEVSPVNTSSIYSIDFTDCDNISTAFLLLTTEISKLLKRADFASLRRALVQQRKTPGGVQFPDDLHQSIKAAKELDTLLDVLADSNYWSWVDLRLLDALIVSSGLQGAKHLIQKYKDAIFPKKLSEILDKLPLPQQKEHKEAYTTKVGTKIQKEPDDVTVGDLSYYCNILETVIMDINNGSCVLEHLDKGCLEIHWFIPTHCRFHAYKSALNNRHKFCDIHLQYLHIEPYPPVYDPFTIQPTILSTLLHLPKPIASTPAEVIGHYHCFLLANFDSSTICQIMLEMKLLTEKDLVYSAKMCSDYQRNSFLLDRLLITSTASIVEFCYLLQNAENQQDIGDMLINDIESIPVDNSNVTRLQTLSQSFSIEESDSDVSITCRPEVFLAAKTVHLRFLNLVSQLKLKFTSYDPQIFLETCSKLTASASHLKAVPVIPSKYLEDLDDDADTEEIFSRLAFLWTWNNHSILKALLEACNCQDGIKMLDTFESQIDATQPIELFPIPPPSMKMAPSLSSAFTVLFIRKKHNLDDSISLQYVNDIATMMAEKFGITLHALQLLAGRTNPLTLYWMILKSIVPLIHNGVDEHLNFFKENQFTEIVIYPSTVLFATDNLNLGPYAMLGSQLQLEVYERNADLQSEVSQLKSSKKYLSNELRKLKDKYHSLSQDFGKSIFINEAEGIMDQLEEKLKEIKSKFPQFKNLKDDEGKESAVKFPSVDYSEMVSDASQRPPAFLNRMQDFKDELEDLKEWYQHIENLQTDLSAKNLEVNQLKSSIDDLHSNLSAQDHRVDQLQSSLTTLQSEYDVKLKEMDEMESEYQAVAEQYRELMEKKTVDKTDSEMFLQYSVPDSLEYDPKEKKTVLHYGAIMGHVPLVQILTRFGADVNAIDKEKRTALHYGAFNGHVSIVEILVNAGANINAADEEKRTALHFGAENGHDSIVDVLVRLGANVNVEDEWTPLHSAARSGHVTIVEILIKSGADVGTDMSKWTPLHVAAKNGHLAVVEVLIKYGASLGTDMVGKWTPLHAAARHGRASVVETLIKSGANAGAAVINKWAPLHIAVKHGHISVIESLVDLGADVNARSTDNWTPLLSAAKNGRTKVAQTLISLGADVQGGDMDKWTPLHAAARHGHVTTVEVLIDSGADVRATDIDKCTPMHGAAEKGHDIVVKILKSHEADVNAITVKEQSPLHLAAEYGHVVVAETLIKSGANMEAATRDKCTPLHLAAQNGHVQVVDTLIKSGANISASTVEKQSPLHIAAEKGHVSVVETLIESGAELDAIENRNWTPLHYSIKKHHVLVTEALIRSGANVNTVDKNESSSLHFAVENNHVDVVDLLIKSKADINASNKAGLTPLHIAAQSGYIQAVKMLIDCGANVDVFNKSLYCPLHLAAKSGHLEVIETLVKAGADIDAVNIKNKWTPLHVAVREDNALVVEKLITLGANVNALNIANRTPLQEAVQFEKQSAIYYFVKELEVDTTQLDEYSQKWIEDWQRDLQKRPIQDYDYDSDYSAISSGHESDASHEE